MEHVRVCRICGHINPADDTVWCDNCRLSLDAVPAITRSEAEQIAHQRRRRIERRRLLRRGLVIILIVGLALWAGLAFFDVGPTPTPTTNVSASIGPQTWAQVGRTPQNAGFTSDQAPIPRKVKWSYATAKPLVSAPVIVGDRVYLATEDGRAVALHRQSGQPIWEYRSGFPSSSTPAVAEDLVLFCLRPGLMVALNRETGDLRWQKEIRDPILASPIIVNGIVYIGAGDSKLYALDANTGRELWGFTASDWIISPVAYADGTIVVASKDNVIHTVDAKRGSRRLIYDTGRSRRIGTGGPAIQGDLAYFGSRGGTVWAIDWKAKTYPLERGILFWKTNLYVWGVFSEPPLQKGSVWTTQVGDDVTQAPAVAHDTVYAATAKGKVVALDAATGIVRWATELGVGITAAPTVAGETVLIGTEAGLVFGLDAHTGEAVWDFQTGGKVTGSPIVVGDTMYVASHDGKLYAVTGAE